VATPLAIWKGDQLLAVVFSPDTPPPDSGTKGGGLLGLRPSSFYNASSDMVAVNNDLPDMVECYPSLSMPVSILFGTALKDKVTGCDLRILSGRGHMLPVTAPHETADWIRAVTRKLAERDA